jgi:hypothetical protein
MLTSLSPALATHSILGSAVTKHYREQKTFTAVAEFDEQPMI